MMYFVIRAELSCLAACEEREEDNDEEKKE